MKVLVACEFSGVVRDAFAARGHDAMSCDLLPTERPGRHYQGDVQDVLGYGWDLMIAHPPCTYLSRSGYHWCNKPDHDTHPLKGEPRRRAMHKAAAFFRLLLDAPIPKKCIENPRPIGHAGLPQSTQVIHPWQFGDAEPKETHLWLIGLPPLHSTNIVAPGQSRIHRMSPGPNRSRERSRTYQGIADAMAEQWSKP